MSAITGASQAAQRMIGETLGEVPVAVTSTAAVAPGIAMTAAGLSRSFGAVLFTGGASGLRAPRNVEDAAILLAEAALTIDAARRAASDARITGATASVRSGLGTAAARIAVANDALYGVDEAGGGLIDQKAAASSDRDTAVARDLVLGREVTRLERRIATLDGEMAVVRSEADATIAALTDDKDAKTAELASLDTRIAAALSANDAGKVAALRAQRATIATDIASINGQIRTTREEADTRLAALAAQRSAATAELAQAKAERAAVRSQIVALDARIAELGIAIIAVESELALGRTALVIAFAQMAVLVQDSGGDRALETMRGTELDHRLDELEEAAKDLRARLLAHFEADARLADDRRDAQADARVMAVVLGLFTALVDVTDVLRREAIPSSEADDSAGRAQRRRLAL